VGHQRRALGRHPGDAPRHLRPPSPQGFARGRAAGLVGRGLEHRVGAQEAHRDGLLGRVQQLAGLPRAPERDGERDRDPVLFALERVALRKQLRGEALPAWQVERAEDAAVKLDELGEAVIEDPSPERSLGGRGRGPGRQRAQELGHRTPEVLFGQGAVRQVRLDRGAQVLGDARLRVRRCGHPEAALEAALGLQDDRPGLGRAELHRCDEGPLPAQDLGREPEDRRVHPRMLDREPFDLRERAVHARRRRRGIGPAPPGGEVGGGRRARELGLEQLGDEQLRDGRHEGGLGSASARLGASGSLQLEHGVRARDGLLAVGASAGANFDDATYQARSVEPPDPVLGSVGLGARLRRG
jgi:hypothetical protein